MWFSSLQLTSGFIIISDKRKRRILMDWSHCSRLEYVNIDGNEEVSMDLSLQSSRERLTHITKYVYAFHSFNQCTVRLHTVYGCLGSGQTQVLDGCINKVFLFVPVTLSSLFLFHKYEGLLLLYPLVHLYRYSACYVSALGVKVRTFSMG